MMGSSQQAEWCRKLTSPTNIRAALKVARKTIYNIVLLTTAAVAGTTGSEEVSVMAGSSSVLICPLYSNLILVTWKIRLKAGGPCILYYRPDQNRIKTTNCSDSINWNFRPHWDPALEIQRVGIVHEGHYTCEVATKEGNFHKTYNLMVLVPPRLMLYCDEHRNPVCEAAAGKPAAQISWAPEGNCTHKEEGHDNGTVSVLSRFTDYSTGVVNATCVVSHPAGNQSKTIVCSSDNRIWFLHCIISFVCLLGLLFLLAVFHLYIFFDGRTMRN